MAGSTGPDMSPGISLSSACLCNSQVCSPYLLAKTTLAARWIYWSRVTEPPSPLLTVTLGSGGGNPSGDSCSRVLYLPRGLAFRGFLTIKTGLLILKILCSW